MKRLAYVLVALFCMMCMSLGAGRLQARNSAAPPTGRVLAMSIVPRVSPPLTPSNMLTREVEATNTAYKAGVRGTIASATWRDLEPAPGHFKLDDLAGGINYFGNLRGMWIELVVSVLNTTTKETPSDLRRVPFDATRMKARFHALIDALAPRLNHHVLYLAIGNEVDVYLHAHNEWNAYTSFYDDALSYVHRVLPWIKVGVTATFGGASGADRVAVARLNVSSDVEVLTYYPLQFDFSVSAPSAPLTDMPAMVALARGLPVVLQEVGYPTSSALGSSEANQAAFVRAVFAAWQTTGNRIPFLSFLAEGDFSQTMCRSLGRYYGLPVDHNFKAYLCSLGLRRGDGRAKAGWQAFQDGAALVTASP